MRILIAEDQEDLSRGLKFLLEKQNMSVDVVYNGLDALEFFHRGSYDVIVLDIMMPGMDGYQVLRTIRKESNIPVMMISAKNQDVDKILGLDLGADDYLTKPFNPLEAMARINSNIRRFYSLGAKGKEVKELKVKDLRLDTEACAIYKNDTLIDLTSVEYRIMRMFMENPGKVFTKQQLYEEGWGEAYFVADNSIMVCISKLRAKLSEENDEYIKTVRGLGYRMERE